jgi:predicted SnoaL-like aldol condensation-catalyzing enzyme
MTTGPQGDTNMRTSHLGVLAATRVYLFLVLVLSLSAANLPARAQMDARAVANKAVVMEVVHQIINARNVDLADQLVTADMVQNLDRPTQGLEAYKAHYRKIFKRYRDYTLDVSHVAADGDIVMVHGRLYGITKGGNKINFNVADIYRMSGGKIAERWHVEQLINN